MKFYQRLFLNLKIPSVERVPGLYIWAIFLFGLAIRLIGIGHQSLWIDEAFSIQSSQRPLLDVVLLQDPTPPLYYLCLHFWMKLTGNGAAMVRVLSAVFGSLSIPAIYFLASKILNKKTGIVSALLLAVSPVNIYLSQLTRTYSLLTLLSIISMYLYIEVSQKKNTKTVWLYAACNVLLVYTHVFAWFIVVAQNLHFLFKHKLDLFKKERWWIYLQLVLIALFTPWFYRYITTCHHHSWISGFHLYQLKDLAINLIAGLPENSPGLMLVLPVALLLAFKPSRRGVLYCWLFIPVILPVLVSVFVSPVFTPKYVFFVSIPLIILMAHALLQLRWSWVAIAVATALCAACTINQQSQKCHDPWNLVVEYVKQIRKDEPIVLIKAYEKIPFSYYYNRSVFNAPEFEKALLEKGIVGVEGIDEVRSLNPPELILITSRLAFEKDRDAIIEYYENTYQTDSVKTFSIESGMTYGNKITVTRLHR